MSSNNFYLIEDKFNVFLYFGMVELFKSRARSRSTLESVLKNESSYIQFMKAMEEKCEKSLREVSTQKQLFSESYGRNISLINRKFLVVSNILSFVEGLFEKEIGEMSFLIEEIKGKIKRINQKKAALNLWKENYSFLHIEKFLNSDFINNRYVKEKSLHINYDQGICLLPVKKDKGVSISNLIISSGNGTPGNSDLEVDSSTQRLDNIVDGNLQTYFEYEKFDEGPLVFELEFVFNGKEIVNSIEIEPFIDKYRMGFEIEDVAFYRDDSESISIRKLNDNKDMYISNSVDSEKYVLNFLPVECISLVIKFKQEEYYDSKRERRLKEVIRRRYSIGIKGISIKSKTFFSKGEVSSKDINILNEVFVGECEANIFPKSLDLYSFSIDGYFGGKWTPLDFETNNKFQSNTFLLNGDENNFKWKGRLSRKDLEFKNKSSYEEDLSELIYVKKTANKKINPCNLIFKGEVKDENISVFCETNLNRSSNRKRYKTIRYLKSDTLKINLMVDGIPATPDGYFIKLDLPINLAELKIDNEDIGVSVNNVDFDEVFYEEDLSANNYFVSYAENSIWFLKDEFPSRGRVRWYLKPEQLRFFSKSNYVYSKFDFFFDPDKDKIHIYSMSSKEKLKNISLTPGRKKYFLNTPGILKSSLKFTTKGNQTFTEQASLKDMYTYSGTGLAYYFDEKSSMLHLSDFLDRGDITKMTFKYREKIKLANDDYEIWEEKSVPLGIKIKQENFKSETIEEKLYSTNMEIYSNLRSEGFTRNKTLDNTTTAGLERKVFELSHSNIIKNSFVIDKDILTNPFEGNLREVNFIDGKSEFLGLIHVEDEFTSEIADQVGVVSFSVGARNLIYRPLGILFLDDGEYFIQESSTPVTYSSPADIGKWYVSPSGEVSVVVGLGSNLPGGIKYSYYYRKHSNQSQGNLYSVDYSKSIIYFNGEVTPLESAKIKYNVSNCIAEYDILKRVSNYKVDFSSKKIEVNSSQFLSERGMVYLFYKKNLFNYNLENVREYFSPLVYDLRFKFK